MFFPLIREMRVGQWTKNVLIFFPLIFSGNITNGHLGIRSLLAFILFSIVASGVYIMNDVVDFRYDKLHEEKKKRPIASGEISLMWGTVVGIILLCFGITLSYILFDKTVFVLFCMYVVLNIFYSISLKTLPPVDLIVVSLFYLLRPVIGAVVIGVGVTNWLILTTFFAALYLVILKRQAEFKRVEGSNIITRVNIDKYSEQVLRALSLIILSVSIVSYAIYSSNFTGLFVLTTIPLVGLGLRSVLLSQTDISTFETPEKFIYTDGISFGFFLVWLISAIGYHV